MRGRSYTPSPPPARGGGYGGRRGRSPSPRGRYGGGRESRDRDLPTSLLVRNLRHDCRPEDLRRPFGQFGPLKDVYLPRDYYSGDPRGFGFVQFVDPADAAEAKYQMDGQMLQGRQLTVVFAEENRKKPTDMRARERRRTPPPRYSRSPPPRYARSRSRDYSPPKRKQYSNSRSVSPVDNKRSMPRTSRERSYSKSPAPYKRREKSPPPAPSPYTGARASPSPPGRDHHNRPHSPPIRDESPAQYSRGRDSDASPSH